MQLKPGSRVHKEFYLTASLHNVELFLKQIIQTQLSEEIVSPWNPTIHKLN